MKHICLIIILTIPLISCKKENLHSGFHIIGKLQNIPDSTIIYMQIAKDSFPDSTLVIGGQFEFKGKVERPKKTQLYFKGYRDYKQFWLENNIIDIKGVKDSLQNSTITGSKTQKEADLLLERKKSIHKDMKHIENMVTESNKDSLYAIYQKMEEEEAKISENFIKEFPNSYESLHALDIWKYLLGGSETSKLFSLIPKELQVTQEGKSIENFIKFNKEVKVGDKYVDFKQENILGKPIQFSSITGKYTLIEFWASWCGPCRQSNPDLVEHYLQYKDKGFEIIGVSLDTKKENWLKAIEKDNLIWENVSDLKGFENEVALMYGVNAIPENFLIDENGIIIAKFLRDETLESKLKELFDKNAPM